MQVGVYLAGAMRFSPKEEEYDRGWRDTVAASFMFPRTMIFNPMEFETLDEEDGHIKLFDTFSIADNCMLHRDIASISRSDIVFMNLLPLGDSDYPFIGTLAELGISIATHKLLVVVADNPMVTEHPFVKAGATRIVSTLDEGIEYTQGLIKGLIGI